MTSPYRRLWPSLASPGSRTAELAVVGRDDAAQILLPIDSRPAMAAALMRHHAGMSLRERAGRQGAAALARWGLLGPLLRRRIRVERAHKDGFDALHEELERILGHSPLSLAVNFGPPRPNRKPVIRAIDRSGVTRGFAKLGWDSLTAALVGTEATILSDPRLRRLVHVTVPELIHEGTWNGHRLAVYSAELGRPGRVTPTPAAFVEVASLWPSRVSMIADSEFATAAKRRAEELAAEGVDGVDRIVTAVLGQWGDAEVETSGWHGDWTPWNTAARQDGGVVLWDWERAGVGALFGFDAIHYRLQPQARSLPADAETLLDLVAGWAAATGVRQARAVAACYLLSISLRHAHRPEISYLPALSALTS